MFDAINSPVFWDEQYKNGNDGWDLKTPNPILLEIIKNKRFLQPCKLLILGSGKGYDAVASAKEGYTVTTIDFSVYANSFAKELAEKENVKIEFLQEDIFNLDENLNEMFDAIYDYTSYCAINPERRTEYAKIISKLLKKNGKFVGHFFPVEKRESGPPFGINISETYQIFSKFLSLDFSTNQINSIKPRRGREVLQVYSKNK